MGRLAKDPKSSSMALPRSDAASRWAPATSLDHSSHAMENGATLFRPFAMPGPKPETELSQPSGMAVLAKPWFNFNFTKA